MTIRRSHRGSRLIGGQLFLAIVAGSVIAPLLFVLLTSLKTRQEWAQGTPFTLTEPTLQNFPTAWSQGRIGPSLAVSIVVVTASVVVILLLASTAGFALGYFDWRASRLILLAVAVLMMMPPTVTVIPIFRLVQTLGLLNSLIGLILVYAAANLPFSIFLLATYFKRLPREPMEASFVEGASMGRAFRSVALPMARPALIAVVALNFVFLWNELLFGLLILQGSAHRTAMVGLAYLRGQVFTDIPVLTAGLVLTMLPVIAVYVLLQRHLVAGLTQGSVD